MCIEIEYMFKLEDYIKESFCSQKIMNTPVAEQTFSETKEKGKSD